MAVNRINLEKIKLKCSEKGALLVAVTKFQSIEDMQVLYNLGVRDFGENKVQEIIRKAPLLPQDIRWHMIGHLQSNKVSALLPYVYRIHGIDSISLLKEIEKQAIKQNKRVHALLQFHIADEDTKFGFDPEKALEIYSEIEILSLQNTKIDGVMGMATFTNDKIQIAQEFDVLKATFESYKYQNIDIKELSMGMSGDYELAIERGSTILRVGSLLFE
jgi:pyridoxal phosphate enzyme (YggS family)